MQKLTQGITATGNFDVSLVDKLGVSLELKKYKTPSGAVNFAAIRDIPVEQRLYSLAKQDLGQAVKLVAVAITMAIETMNLTRPMNAFQILDLAEVIIEESESDKLSIPDLLLFLQRLTRGYYPGLFEGIDALKILERFNQYRDERWNEMIALRDAQIEHYKTLGDSNTYERENPRDASTLGLQLEHYRQKVQVRSDEAKSRKQ